jgi:hypothetical protein
MLRNNNQEQLMHANLLGTSCKLLHANDVDNNIGVYHWWIHSYWCNVWSCVFCSYCQHDKTIIVSRTTVGNTVVVLSVSQTVWNNNSNSNNCCVRMYCALLVNFCMYRQSNNISVSLLLVPFLLHAGFIYSCQQFRARKIEKGLSLNVVLARDFTRAFFTLWVKFTVFYEHHLRSLVWPVNWVCLNIS